MTYKEVSAHMSTFACSPECSQTLSIHLMVAEEGRPSPEVDDTTVVGHSISRLEVV